MKKILFSIALLTGFSVNAQLPDGSVAPDFTLTDINGTSHNLYTYLDQGKTVFLDISATWCGPCWSFHNSGALDDLWAAHGPAGGNGVNANTTDDVIVIYIEGDGTTNAADLNGTGTNTQGDWVTGVDHPIIDPAAAIINAFNNDYAIGYFPTIYKICPNRIISEPGQASAAALYAGVSACPPPASQNVDVKALANKGDLQICGPANYTPKVQIQNNGLSALTSASVSVTLNGTEVATGTYTGSLATYGVATITCSVIPNFTGGNLVMTISSSNDADITNNSMNVGVVGAIETNNTILLTALTDGYASETSWRIKNAAGATVAGTTDPTLANNTTYNFTYTLPTLGCYTYSITDSYGDGMTPGTINVRDNASVNILNNADFGDGIDIPFKVVTMNPPNITSTSTITNQTITKCTGSPVTLTSTYSTGNIWSNGATTTSINVTESGTYTVTAAGLTSNSIEVIFLTSPIVDAGIDLEGCQGTIVTLTGTGADSYSWSNGISNNAPFAITNTTNYTVTGTAANGCTDTDVVTVTSLSPTVDAGANFGVCEGTLITLNGSGADSYTWDNGVTNNTPFVLSATSTFTVTGTSANGCTDTDLITVTLKTNPTVNAGNDVSVCEGAMVTLAGSGATTYSWTNGVTNNTEFAVMSTTTYTVTGTTNGCIDTDEITVTKLDLPTVDAGTDLNVCAGSMVTLNGSGASIYSWSNGIANNQAFAANGNVTYTVTGTDAIGCSNTDMVTVNTYSCSGIDENTINAIKVYPNPTAGNINIASDVLTQYTTIELIDISGRILSTWEINATSMNIEMKEIANGNYTLVFKGANSIATQKIQIAK